MLAVGAMLAAAEMPAALAGPILASFGAGAAAQLGADPWRLLLLPDVRPAAADRFALGVLAGRPTRDDARRLVGLTRHLLTRAAADGHTVLPAATLLAGLGGLGLADPAAALRIAVDTGAVTAAGQADGHALLALPGNFAAEQAVAAGVARLLATARPFGWPIADPGQQLDPAQRSALQNCAAAGVSLLTGGPGTGRGRTVSVLARLARPAQRVILAAATAAAANRLAEVSGLPVVPLPRLLPGTRRVGEPGRAARAASETGEQRLPGELVVVTEASSLDLPTAAALLRACADGTHLLLVGDPALLPPAGPGRVFGDLLAAGRLPVSALRTVHRRTDGAIDRLAEAVRDGRLPQLDPADRQVVVVPAGDGAVAAHRVRQLVTDSIPRVLAIPAADVQVCTPLRRGPAGADRLNATLKAALNPGPGLAGGFDPADRVVAVADHPDGGFRTGDVGTVTAADPAAGLQVTFPAGPVRLPVPLVGALRPGWAVTACLAQSGRWPAAVAVFPPDAGGLLSRPLVYTALTRGCRHLSVVHAAGPLLARAVAQVGARPRRTRLTALLQAAVSTGPAAGPAP